MPETVNDYIPFPDVYSGVYEGLPEYPEKVKTVYRVYANYLRGK
jgi:hypothetical protein